MNMAAAVTATSGLGAHFAISSLRAGLPSSASVDPSAEAGGRVDGPDAANQDAASQDAKEAAYPRFVSPVLEYNQGAERMVMLFRDPTSGKTTDQIPSEAALKQYQEAAQRTRAQRNSDALTGGEEDGANSGPGFSAKSGRTASSGAGTGTGAGSKGPSAIKIGGSFAAVDAVVSGAAASGAGGAAAPSAAHASPSFGSTGYRGSGAPTASFAAGYASAGARVNFVV